MKSHVHDFLTALFAITTCIALFSGHFNLATTLLVGILWADVRQLATFVENKVNLANKEIIVCLLEGLKLVIKDDAKAEKLINDAMHAYQEKARSAR